MEIKDYEEIIIINLNLDEATTMLDTLKDIQSMIAYKEYTPPQKNRDILDSFVKKLEGYINAK